MKINTLKDFQKLVQTCRKLGVDAMEVDGIKFNLGPAPKVNRRASFENDFPEADIKIPAYNPITNPTVTYTSETAADIIKSDSLTEDQLLFYSAENQDEVAN